MRRLLIMNYAMDSKDAVFPHQIGIVAELSSTWDQVFVITYSTNPDELSLVPSNVVIMDLNWHKGSKFVAILKLFYFFLKVTLTKDQVVLFSYMTETLSALIAPLANILNIRHILWYAHASKPQRLSWCHLWVDKLVTSTQESCPIHSKKVIPIGQAVDQTVFSCPDKKVRSNPSKMQVVHVGRLDPSKNIEKIIELFIEKFQSKGSVLHLIGTNSEKHGNYESSLKSRFKSQVDSGQVIFHGKRDQAFINNVLCQSDIFLHAFSGSLDKTLIEAILSKTFVISSNQAFIKEFGCLGKATKFDNLSAFLSQELNIYQQSDVSELQSIVDRRYQHTLDNHSRRQWLKKLNQVLLDA